MKKWALGLGSVAAIAAPVATVVSCGLFTKHEKLASYGKSGSTIQAKVLVDKDVDGNRLAREIRSKVLRDSQTSGSIELTVADKTNPSVKVVKTISYSSRSEVLQKVKDLINNVRTDASHPSLVAHLQEPTLTTTTTGGTGFGGTLGTGSGSTGGSGSGSGGTHSGGSGGTHSGGSGSGGSTPIVTGGTGTGTTTTGGTGTGTSGTGTSGGSGTSGHGSGGSGTITVAKSGLQITLNASLHATKGSSSYTVTIDDETMLSTAQLTIADADIAVGGVTNSADITALNGAPGTVKAEITDATPGAMKSKVTITYLNDAANPIVITDVPTAKVADGQPVVIAGTMPDPNAPVVTGGSGSGSGSSGGSGSGGSGTTTMVKPGLVDIMHDAWGGAPNADWTGITRTVRADGTVVINVPQGWALDSRGRLDRSKLADLHDDIEYLGFVPDADHPTAGTPVDADHFDFTGPNGEHVSQMTFGNFSRNIVTAHFLDGSTYTFEVIFDLGVPTPVVTPPSSGPSISNLHTTDPSMQGDKMRFLMHNAATGHGNASLIGVGRMPILEWDSTLTGVSSYGIIVKDLDAGGAMHSIILGLDGTKTTFDHSRGGSNDADSATIATNLWSMLIPQNLQTFTHGVSGSTLESHHWVGPFPPAGQTHRYEFTVYAFNAATTAKFTALKTSIASMINGVSDWNADHIQDHVQHSLDTLLNPILGEAIGHTSKILTYTEPL